MQIQSLQVWFLLPRILILSLELCFVFIFEHQCFVFVSVFHNVLIEDLLGAKTVVGNQDLVVNNGYH